MSHSTKSLILASLLFPTCHLVAQAPIRLDFLAKTEEASGCCGFFYLATDKSKDPRQVFGYEGNGHTVLAPIRVNGKLYKVTNTKFQNHPVKKGKSSIGDRITQVWQNAQIRIDLDLRTVEFEKEGIGVRGTLKVSFNGQKETFSIVGYIGA
jgi:hypothetical protein